MSSHFSIPLLEEHGGEVRNGLHTKCSLFRLEFEAEGRCHILSLYEPLEIVAKEDWEATLPKEKLDDKSNEADSAAVTPAAEQSQSATGGGAGATPKSGFGGRFKKKKRFGATPNKGPFLYDVRCGRGNTPKAGHSTDKMHDCSGRPEGSFGDLSAEIFGRNSVLF